MARTACHTGPRRDEDPGRGEAEVRGDRLGPGDFFGELALLDDTTRTADVIAAADLTVLQLDREGFDAFARYSDAVAGATDSRRLAR